MSAAPFTEAILHREGKAPSIDASKRTNDGSLTSERVTSDAGADANGFLLYVVKYDTFGRMTRIYQPASETTLWLASGTYDALGRLSESRGDLSEPVCASEDDAYLFELQHARDRDAVVTVTSGRLTSANTSDRRMGCTVPSHTLMVSLVGLIPIGARNAQTAPNG